MSSALRIAQGFSPDVLRFAGVAISANTRKSYDAPVRGYERYCAERGLSPSVFDLSAAMGANYLGFLGAQGRLSGATIRVYRSALSTWWCQGTLSDSDNPMLSTACDLVLKGIHRDHFEKDKASRLARAPAVEITAQMLQEIGEMGADAPDPRSVMMWAAANVALYGFLRPGELLGSYANPKRALRPEQIRWFVPHASASGPSAPAAGAPPPRRPSHFTIDLGVTKADQAAKNPPKGVAAQPAVDALWAWMQLRRALGPAPGSVLFGLPGEAPLSMGVLLVWLADWYAADGRPRPRFTGKGFRRGAASTAFASGAPIADIAAQGRWKNGKPRPSKMPETYANAAAAEARSLLFNRGLAPSQRA